MKVILCLLVLTLVTLSLGSPIEWLLRQTLRFKMYRKMLEKASYEMDKPLLREPSSCAKYKCPPYEVVKKYHRFEERSYNAMTWAETSVYGGCPYIAAHKMYQRLVGYFNGLNCNNKTLDRTAPVSVFVSGDKRKDAMNFTMRFFIPEGVAAPRPTDKTVSVVTLPARKVFVRSFTGYVLTLRRFWTELKLLARGVKKINGKVDTSGWLLAVYDPPTRIFHRHNEVALIVKPNKTIGVEDYDVAKLFN